MSTNVVLCCVACDSVDMRRPVQSGIHISCLLVIVNDGGRTDRFLSSTTD